MNMMLSKEEAVATTLDAVTHRRWTRRRFLEFAMHSAGMSAASALAISAQAAGAAENQAKLETQLTSGYDFIIIGAGTAGCVLAHRLSADERVRVLVLEAGVSDIAQNSVADPRLWGRNIRSPLDWGYGSVPQPGLAGGIFPLPVGKVLGGGSSINAMIYVRGNPANYEPWAGAGGDQWSYKSMAEAFTLIESYNPATPGRGRTGPFEIGPVAPNHPVTLAALEACRQLGWKGDSLHSGLADDVSWMNYAIKDGVRVSAARAYLHPAMVRRNLTVLQGATVTSLVFEGKRCTGVEVLFEGKTRKIVAERETLLAAGVFNSPKLLMLAGVGSAQTLKALGIASRMDLPGVGNNLHDHLLYRAVNFKSKGAIPPPPIVGGQLHAFARADGAQGAPDLQFIFGALPIGAGGLKIGEGFSILPGLMQPRSRGSVRLASSDPLASPIIDPAYFSDPEDIKVLVKGISRAREIVRTSSYAEIVANEVAPGDVPLEAAVRRTAAPYFHWVGTCALGDVVDAELRVKGIDGLRVVDASVIPVIPSSNPMAPVLAIAEIAARQIQRGWRRA